MKKTAIFCVIAMILISFSGCYGEKKEIRTLIESFNQACNQCDLNAMLSCVQPETAKKIEYAAGIAGKLSAMEPAEVLDKLAKLILGVSDAMENDFFGSLKINVNKIEITENTATADTVISYTSGETKEKSAILTCVKAEDRWYIEDIDIK